MQLIGSTDRMVRAGLAALAAAAVAIFTVSGYHPCEGIGPLVLLVPASAVITLVAGVPSFTPRAMIMPGAVAVVVMAVAIGLDYSGSGPSAQGIELCEPVPGFAGFLLAAFISGVLAAIGLAGALLLAWLVQLVLHLQSRPPGSQEANGAGVNNA